MSPSKNIQVDVFLSDDGQLAYLTRFLNKVIIDTSFLSFDFQNQPSLRKGLTLIATKQTAFKNIWEMPWGEQRMVTNHHNEFVATYKEAQAPNRSFSLYFRAYDDGVAFRYEFLDQPGSDSLIILEENTEFNFTDDHTTWWTPGDWDSYEYVYNTTPISKIDAIKKGEEAGLGHRYIPANAVNTPITIRTKDGIHISLHEANLTDYAGMTLKVDSLNHAFTSGLVGSERFGYKVKRALPFKTPWRTIQITEKATDLIQSNLIVNLNEPNKLEDIGWFEPMKYVGIWWEMHLNKSSWDYASGRHGATTENAKKLIDFASENGIKGMLVEGWNTGWERWIGFEDREGVFDFVSPYPDYDLEEVVRYGKEKGVDLIMHHETSAAPRTYDQQLDTAFSLMKSLGIHAVKTGYVGKIIPTGEHHHGQWMVNHYRRVLEKGADYQIAINAHEPIKPTGLRRTFPNAISREGLRGQEFNAWAADGGNSPEHISIVAFTRMLAGPIDFTPGVFDIKMNAYKPNNQVNTTLAHQLALYVVIYSPIQMACDLIENYQDQPAFQFIRDVGVDWEQTKVLNGEVGDFVTIARQERGSDAWFVGGVTDENERMISIDFNFLDANKTYVAKIYRDGSDAHWDKNPTSILIEERKVTSDDTIDIELAAGGGFAISLEREIE